MLWGVLFSLRLRYTAQVATRQAVGYLMPGRATKVVQEGKLGIRQPWLHTWRRQVCGQDCKACRPLTPKPTGEVMGQKITATSIGALERSERLNVLHFVRHGQQDCSECQTGMRLHHAVLENKASRDRKSRIAASIRSVAGEVPVVKSSGVL